MKRSIAFLASLAFLAPSIAQAASLAPGIYQQGAQSIYVGVENESPDPPVNQYFDPRTQHTGELRDSHGLRLREGLREERRTVATPAGPLGVSLYYAGDKKRSAVILIHGNDAETREIGFIIPYFVLNGINVISYDQRGTGASSGNWQLNGPAERATDVEAVYDAFASDAHVDAKRLGIWGFSNGGWTAPIVASARPVAFMILKSAPAESLQENIMYEVTQRMHRDGYDDAATATALNAWRALLAALSGSQSWDAARSMYDAASSKPWFEAAMLPPHLTFPLPAPLADGFRRAAMYDPAEALQKVRTPTLALYGALDRNVDTAHDAPALQAAFTQAGMRDFTMHVYPDAGHTLKVSETGYNNQPSMPERFAPGYPEVMIQWLGARGFLR